MSAGYTQAQTELKQILAAPEFRPKPQTEPWWVPVARWILRHLNLHMTPSNWRLLTWVIGLVAAAAILLSVAWWLVQTVRRDVVETRRKVPPARPVDDPYDGAGAALRDRQVEHLLHLLVETCILLATKRKWAQAVANKTQRQYLRELRTTADESFLQVFSRVVTAAEAVLFAKRSIPLDEAKALYDAVGRLRGEDSR